MTNRQPLVAGNWKLNGSRSSVVELSGSVARGLTNSGSGGDSSGGSGGGSSSGSSSGSGSGSGRGSSHDGGDAITAEVLVCPSFVHLSDVLAVIGNTAVHLGAQDCSEQGSGAFTGDTAAEMLAEFGCEYVIVGHSERRQLYGDSDASVVAKAAAVRAAGMTPIICVGETLEERENGQVEAVIGRQLEAQLTGLSQAGLQQSVIAYEPVWAIGTGLTASKEQAQEVHAMIRGSLRQAFLETADQVRILYGGSVKPANAAELFAQADIDGGLIGGAALNSDDFLAICRAASA